MSENLQPDPSGHEANTGLTPAPQAPPMPSAPPIPSGSPQQGTGMPGSELQAQPWQQQGNQYQGQQHYGYQQQPHPVTYVTVVNPKSVGVAYVLLIFLGGLGIHKFYMDKVGMGITYLCLGFFGSLLTLVLIGWFVLAALWIMMIIDLFTLAGDVRRFNARHQPGTHPMSAPQGY